MLPDIHDSTLVGYAVHSKIEELWLFIEPGSGQSFESFRVVFSNARAHLFKAPLLPAILGGIYPQDATEIIQKEWPDFVSGFARNGWPGPWGETLNSAQAFVEAEGLTGFRIESSYGLSGWVLASSVSVDVSSVSP